jgi:hypothetical protein
VELVKVAAHNLGFHVAKDPSGNWMEIDGIMSSGSKVTAGGDSKILAKTFYKYVAFIIKTKPCGGALFQAAMNRDVGIGVSGDDNVSFVPKIFRAYVNYESFCEFVKKMDMRFKEGSNRDKFLTEIDAHDNIIKPGVKFLQYYFVKRESVTSDTRLPPVLPYKTADRLMSRIMYGNSGENRDPISLIAGSIGLAYASCGTNSTAYNFLEMFHHQMVLKVDMDNWLKDFMNKNRHKGYIDKILRKGGITIKELAEGWPSREKLLARNIYDEKRHIYFKDMHPSVIRVKDI